MTGTAPCYGCGERPIALYHTGHGEQPVVCATCRFGICDECSRLNRFQRPCCARALDEGWAETGDWWSPKGLVGYAASRQI